MHKQASNKTILSFVLTLILSGSSAAIAKPLTKVEKYLCSADQIIGRNWAAEEDSVGLDSHLCQHNKAVLSFTMDKQGRLKNIRLKHANWETFLFSARHIYKEEAEEKLAKTDRAMIQSLKQSSPLPPPPKELNCPRSFTLVFDSNLPPRMLIDDRITPASVLSNTTQ